ncbi:DUF599 domain-containing protein [Neptunicella marina]|uniref:DUF599 domain-containing protein n=1 Tax=Neptunicella marina TaxID=2125989 RepID=A0A8J6IRD6_9ALTE|nr:DUF599 domain-containing protein [Neptunicella marina]MBC3764492.1 DUF599 domain-containing protein [Neptunicella marina]
MTLIDIVGLVWFLVLWVGYTLFAKQRARTTLCLASELRAKRNNWMLQMLLRENRIADVAIIAAQERNISFFASSALLIIAGLLTALSSAEQLSNVLHQVIPGLPQTTLQIQLKLVLMVCIFVFAFFQFTWALRQYGFGGALVGAAPNGNRIPEEQLETYANRTAKVIDQAGHSLNYGLRALYMSLSTLAWFIDSRLFMFTTVLVVLVMYQREFHSKALKALKDCV